MTLSMTEATPDQSLKQSNLYFSVTHEEDCFNENKFSETVLIFFLELIFK